jgi:hypothetical protein
VFGSKAGRDRPEINGRPKCPLFYEWPAAVALSAVSSETKHSYLIAIGDRIPGRVSEASEL